MLGLMEIKFSFEYRISMEHCGISLHIRVPE